MHRSICDMSEVNTSTKAMEWLICLFVKKLTKLNMINYILVSALAHIYGYPKIHKFSSSDSFPTRHLIVSFIGTFNYNFPHFLCDFPSSLVPNDYSDYSCKDNFSNDYQIKNANLSKKCFVS